MDEKSELLQCFQYLAFGFQTLVIDVIVCKIVIKIMVNIMCIVYLSR